MNTIPSVSAFRYLIIDDDNFTCDCIVKLLQRHGAQHVKAMDNALDALGWLEKNSSPPDIIICDLNMPEMDGIEFMQMLAKQNFKGGILLISASIIMLETFMNLVRAKGLNVLGSVSKPLNLDKIVPLISHMDKRKSA